MLNWLATSCNVIFVDETSAFATIIGVTASVGLPGLGLILSLSCPPWTVKPSFKRQTKYVGFRKTSAAFEKYTKVFNPLKAGILLQISVPPA